LESDPTIVPGVAPGAATPDAKADTTSHVVNNLQSGAAAAEPPKLSPSSMIFTKRSGEMARDETKSSAAENRAAESSAAEEMERKTANPAQGDDISSRHPSTIVSPGAQASASVTRTESNANPDAARLLTIMRVSPSASSEIINRSELKQPPTSQAAAQLTLQNSAAVKSEETRVKAVAPLTMDETEAPGAMGATQLPFRSGTGTHPEISEAAIERDRKVGLEVASVQMSSPDSETALPLVPSRQESTTEIVNRSVSSPALSSLTDGELVLRKAPNVESTGQQQEGDALSAGLMDKSPDAQPDVTIGASVEATKASSSEMTLATLPTVNQPAAPSRIERFAQGDQLGASASTENSAVNKQSGQPVFAREIRESSSRTAEPTIIWRTSTASTPADQSVGAAANGTMPLILRQPENPPAASEQSQSDQAIVPPAATEQAQGVEIDVGQITRSVIRSLSRRLAVERERRGIVK
jgi:hypothetical protein